jgi:hypothetical protein
MVISIPRVNATNQHSETALLLPNPGLLDAYELGIDIIPKSMIPGSNRNTK